MVYTMYIPDYAIYMVYVWYIPYIPYKIFIGVPDDNSDNIFFSIQHFKVVSGVIGWI